MKNCTECGVRQPLANFYALARMADGHINQCKKCKCRKASDSYQRNRQKLQEYDKQRGKTPRRKAQRKECAARYVEKHPDRERAKWAVGNAKRSGRLVSLPCEVCGSTTVDAHHDDYSRPLDVRWLCRAHHKAHHNHTKPPFD